MSTASRSSTRRPDGRPDPGPEAAQRKTPSPDRSSSATTGGLYGSDLGANLTRSAAAEAIGTYLLVLAGTAVAVGGTLHNGFYDGLAAAFAFGLTLAALVTGLGHVSGCHLNPAVTLGLAATKKFPVAYVPAYLIAQVVGAALASLTVWAAFGGPARSVAKLGTPSPAAGMTVVRTGLVELVITFLLVLVIMAVATDERVPASAAGVAVGFALFAAVAIGGTVTGGSVNPARALGPMLVSGYFPMWAVYLIAPVIGGVIASVVYDQVLSPADKPEA
jgi:MIP family channel proteins